MKQLKKRASMLTLSVMLTALSLPAAKANNLTLGGLALTAATTVTFTISWDNSWYASTVPNNWDAVWVFLKYKDCATTNWLHATLNIAATHSVTGGSAASLQVDPVTDGMGVFIRRNTAGTSGPIATTTVSLTLTAPSSGTYNFKVFGIEMVRVLNENFLAGDGSSTGYFNGTATNITSENALTAANLGGAPAAAALPAAFPKGWNAFYCMKYEITQEEWVDFLNTLTYDQQATRTSIAPNSSALNWVNGSNFNRNGLKIKTQGVNNTTPAVYGLDYNGNNTLDQTTDGQNIPYNYLSWGDLIAYLDWSCLRPMTELEFEKICRGADPRVPAEYVWGNTTILIATANPPGLCLGAGFNNRGAANEVFSTSGNGLCAYDNSGACNNTNSTYAGPVRAGFAATASTNRQGAGASYYGAMDMGGNLSEQTVQTNADGSAFTGTLGDGTLDASGNANAANWPASTGAILRGGDWYNAASYVQTSTRNQGSASAGRPTTQGGRGVR